MLCDNLPMRINREALLESALQLPIAEKSDFLDWSHQQGDERVIRDTSLRAKLIKAALAEGVQSPKGPQAKAFPSIVRLYPDGDAPGRVRVNRVEPVPHVAAAKPTIDDLKALITRIEAVEAHVAREMQIQSEEDIRKLRERIASVPVEELHVAHAELGKALEISGNGKHHARLEALKRIENDHEFPQRVFLGLIAA